MHGLLLWLPFTLATSSDKATQEPANESKYDESWESLPVTVLPAPTPVPPLPEPREVSELASERSPELSQVQPSQPLNSPAPEALTLWGESPPEEPPPEEPPPEEPLPEEPLPEEPPPEEPPPEEPLPEEPPPEQLPPEQPPSQQSPYADFPHPSGGEFACEHVSDCWLSPLRENSNSWREEAGNLKSDLEAKGLQVEEISSEEESIKIFEVKKDGEFRYYLNIVPIDSIYYGGITYRITEQPMTEAELEHLKQQQPPS